MDYWRPSLWHCEKTYIFSLLIKCPFGDGVKPDCPLKEHRVNNTLEEKYFLAIDLVSDARSRSLLKRHEDCLAGRQVLSPWLRLVNRENNIWKS